MENKENYFIKLNSIDVGEKIEQKNGLSYLSWAWAWGEVKKIHPDAIYTIYERDGELGPINYFTDGKTCWVKTGVTINGIEHIEELPVMNYNNKSIPLASVTSFDVNKSIQRSLTKALARHGLGLYIYAGEDLQEESKDEQKDESKSKGKNTKGKTTKEEQDTVDYCAELEKFITDKKLDKLKVCAKYKLNKTSKQEDFKNALLNLKIEVGE